MEGEIWTLLRRNWNLEIELRCAAVVKSSTAQHSSSIVRQGESIDLGSSLHMVNFTKSFFLTLSWGVTDFLRSILLC